VISQTPARDRRATRRVSDEENARRDDPTDAAVLTTAGRSNARERFAMNARTHPARVGTSEGVDRFDVIRNCAHAAARGVDAHAAISRPLVEGTRSGDDEQMKSLIRIRANHSLRRVVE